MALLFFDGFETGEDKPEYTTQPGRSASGSTRTGTYAATGSATAVLSFTPSATVIVGAAIYNTTFPSPTGNFHLQFRGDAGATQHLTIGYDANRAVTLRLGGVTGTLLATSTYIFPLSEWRYLEASATIADTGGRCVVKVDGVTVIDYTGDTRNAGTSTNIDRIAWTGSTANAGLNTRWDDLYVLNGIDATATQGRPNNTFLGDIKVEPLYPNADGAVNQFIGSDGNSVSNYLLVDEAGTPSMTDYVASSTPGDRDLYGITDLAANIGTVYGIRTFATVAKSDVGSAGMKLLNRDTAGTVTEEVTATPLSTTASVLVGPIRPTKPGTATPWTAADINGHQIGVESTA